MEIIIVGGGYAGLTCATRLARRARSQGTPARIRVVDPTAEFVERIRLHQRAAGQPLPARRIDRLLRACGAEFVQGRVRRIDPVAQVLELDGERLDWDRLVLAIGSHASPPDVPAAADNAFAMDPGSTHELLGRLQGLAPQARVAVIGGGVTAIETASELAEAFAHLQVHIVARGAVGEDFSPIGREHVLRTLTGRLGVKRTEYASVRKIHGTHLESDRGAIEFDLCIWAAGFSLPALAGEAGLCVNPRGQVQVDPALRSVSHPRIYAAGDVASPVLAPGQAVPMGCKSAMPMGALVADNLARELRGEAAQAFDYALPFYCVSLGRRDGLIQWADDDGRLTGRVWTGRRAALFKEAICRSTWWALKLEARGIRGVVWQQTGRAPRELDAARRSQAVTAGGTSR